MISRRDKRLIEQDNQRFKDKVKQGKFKYKSYKDYLLSNIWKKKRKKVLERDGYCCKECGQKSNLQVHHKTYKRVYKEPLKDLIVLCSFCHKDKHNLVTKDEITDRVTKMMANEGIFYDGC